MRHQEWVPRCGPLRFSTQLKEMGAHFGRSGGRWFGPGEDLSSTLPLGLTSLNVLLPIFSELKHPLGRMPTGLHVYNFSALLLSDYEDCLFHYLHVHLSDWTLKSSLFQIGLCDMRDCSLLWDWLGKSTKYHLCSHCFFRFICSLCLNDLCVTYQTY